VSSSPLVLYGFNSGSARLLAIASIFVQKSSVMKAALRLLTVFSCYLLGPGAAGAIDLKFIPSSGSVALGNSIDVAIAVSGLGVNSAPSLGAFSFDVAFADSLVKYKNTTFGGQLALNGVTPVLRSATDNKTSVFLEESSNNTITELNALQAAEFTLAVLTFQAIALGNSPLNFENVTLGDANGDPLTANLFNGSIGIIPNPSALIPEPSLVPAVLVLAGIGVLVEYKRRAHR
jgi:hypothetical protein